MSSDIIRKSEDIAVKFAEPERTGLVRGLASPFNGEADRHGDVIAPGAYRKSIGDPGKIPMLWSHDFARPVGRWTRFSETDTGLEVEGILNLNSEAGREAYEHLKHRDATGLSIGYYVPSGGWERLGRGGRLLKEIVLMEISFVTIPSADRARIAEVKSFTSPAELKSALRSIGIAKSAAERITRGGWPALTGGNPENEITEDLIGNIREMRIAAAEIRKVLK